MSKTLNVKKFETDHFDERQGCLTPDYIILHCPQMSATDAHPYYTGEIVCEAGRISPHYMITEAGEIYQYVDENKRAWHAGVARWKGLEDFNSRSIGIEISPKYAESAFQRIQEGAVRV